MTPLLKLAMQMEQVKEEIKGIHSVLTVDLKKASDDHFKEMKMQTSLLQDIKGILIATGLQATLEKKSPLGGIGSKLPKMDGSKDASLAVALFAGAVLASSLFFALMPTLSVAKLLTAAAVAGLMALVVPQFMKLTKLYRFKPKNIIKAAAIFPLITLALLLSALPLMLMPNVSVRAIFTTLIIGIMLSLFVPTFTKLLYAVRGLKYKDIFKAASVMPIIALSIVAVALMFTALDAVGGFNAPPLGWILKAGLAIWLFSGAFAMISSSVRGLGVKEMIYIGVAMGLIALGVVSTALFFQMLSNVGSFEAPPLGWVFTAGLAVIIFAGAFALIASGIKGLGFKDLLKIPIAMGLIAGGIIGVAFMFNYLTIIDSYNAPPLGWTLKAGLAILIFSFAFTMIAKTAGKVGFKGMIMAGLAIPIIALGIMATAFIFSYLTSIEAWNAPPIEWTMNAGIAIATFGVAFVAVALLATALTPVALLLGAAGVILIAGVIWVVAWIFSKIPEGAAAGAQTLSKALFAPMNEMVNVFKRFKDEIGIENLIPLGKGLIAVSAGYLSLAGAMTGTAIGGVISGIVGAGKKVLDFVTFGLTKSDTPFDLLDKLSSRLPQIIALSKPIYNLGNGMKHIARYSEGGVAGIGAIIKLGGGHVSNNLGKVRTSLRGISKSFGSISKSSNTMNVASIDAATKMFDAIAKVAELGGEDAMSVLARELMTAVNELSEAVDKMDESVKKQPSGIKGALDGALGGFLDKIKGKTDEVKNSGESGGLVDVQPIVDAIQELEDIFMRPLRVVEVS
jgi:hypothetical protein